MALRLMSAAVVACALALAPVAKAQDSAPKDDPQALFEQATRQMLQALQLMLKAIPQYEAPVVLDNGDILIRRKHPENDPAPTPEPPLPPNQDRT